jgi:hypothetical protein
MKYQLVLQWPAASIDDYDSMVEIENLLIDQLAENSEVDGHDLGSGEMNIFILTNTPEQAFIEVKRIFAARGLLAPTRAAYREIGKEEYNVLWPKGSKEFSIA